MVDIDHFKAFNDMVLVNEAGDGDLPAGTLADPRSANRTSPAATAARNLY